MEKSVLRSSNSSEIETLSTGILSEIAKVDLSKDLMISSIISELGTETTELSLGIEQTRGNVLKENLNAENKIADDAFVCYKQFVKANTYLPDDSLAQDAADIWELTESHNLQLHRQAYEKQISLSKSLLSNLASDKFKDKVAGLIGVPDRVQKLSESATSLEIAYNKVNELNSNDTSYIAPSTQKNTVRKIINENLIPYLETSSKVMPETYTSLYNMACEAIGSLNIKIRARKTRNTKDIEETVAE